MPNEKQYDYQYQGARVGPRRLIRFLEYTLTQHLALGLKRPICIWGRHGIGKTEIVETYAREKGFQLRYIAPAQFEEMGDLTGMPAIENGRTVFRPPGWVPAETGPGILLIDDVNRADDRILRGIMQLLQRHELAGWQLPDGWQIILTANPDGGDYSVTPMDDAMLTRMLHITLEFNPDDWLRWAENAGIDDRCIRFIRAYPESVTGEKTTPRTLVQFFEAIAPIEPWTDDLELVQTLGEASLDLATVAAFLHFIQHGNSSLPSAEAILNADNFSTDIAPALQLKRAGTDHPVGQLHLLGRQVVAYLQRAEDITSLQAENFRKFLTVPGFPADIRLKVLQELNHHPRFDRLTEGDFLNRVLLNNFEN